ncbi:superoxide dismutase [Spiroplasma endosymbiont of Panorpa germanica]|uniref:superoxide dismutase n=1 Tax=Spiroplasma endosymbiont of Panorpa germanica TaxID=3066314 RepID=UPI0030CF6F54
MFKRIELEQGIEFLEPVLSKEQINLHYNRFHLEYEDKLNKGLGFFNLPRYIENLDDLVKSYLSLPKEFHILVRQYGGGLINLNFYFKNFKKDVTLKDGILKDAIFKNFMTLDEFCKEMVRNAMSIFGSGWTWLVLDKNKNMRVYNTFNQDNPWFLGMTPLIGICLWEHAYILDYKNDRENYVKNLLTIIDWDYVQEIYANALR